MGQVRYSVKAMKKEIFIPLIENKTAQSLMAHYIKAGFDIRFVGGCVRDCIQGVPIGDIDMATTATPEQGQALLQKAGVKTIPTGIDHGTITAVVDGIAFEITTLRCDIATDGRHATVAYTNDWEQDAARRDFTMNAMSLDSNGVLYDPFDGVADLKTGHVHFIGQAQERIKEDALRILRFFRFNASVGKGEIDPNGLDACIAQAHLLETLSVERVKQELDKMLKGKNLLPIWQVISDKKINDYFLKKSNNIKCLENIIEVNCKEKPLLLSLFLTSDRDAEALQKSLKLSNKETRHLQRVLKAYQAEWQNLPSILYQYEGRAVCDAALLRYGDGQINQGQMEHILEQVKNWQQPVFPVTGDDLLSAGFVQGKKMGEALKKLEQYWIENNFTPNKEECLAQL